ncbi:MAG: Nif11 family protein [Schwartzia sp.]|nr:Nif11 family protein [Schwartzia sp. (in: firmicutes)]
MATINKNELTKEQIEKAMACQTADELMELAKTEGFDITKDEAEAYMAELADVELDDEALSKAAGGVCYKLGYSSHCSSRSRLPRHQAVP